MPALARSGRTRRVVATAVSLVVVSAAAVATSATGSVAGAAAPVEGYVALGDSYASGVGTGSYALDARCKRSSYAYPAVVAQQRANTALTFVACSGATTTDVLVGQVAAVTSTTNLVSVTVGGNDLGFGTLISQCVQTDCSATLGATRATAAATLTPRLDAVYGAIRTRAAPGAKVVVVGYPRLFSTTICFGTAGISTAERSGANLLSDEIERVTAARAAAFGFAYKSAIAPFTGHAVCSGSAWVNGLNIFSPAESFHPTRSGQSSGYAPLARQVLG